MILYEKLGESENFEFQNLAGSCNVIVRWSKIYKWLNTVNAAFNYVKVGLSF